jgi:hypothetical protein
LHDGGTHLDIAMNGKVVCKSEPTYGTDEQARARAEIAKTGGIAAAAPEVGSGHAHSAPMASMPKMPGMNSQHIIAMSICADNKAGVKDIPISPLGLQKLVKGQSWALRAYYDYVQHPGMKNNVGGMSTVMGISIMYVKTAKKRMA